MVNTGKTEEKFDNAALFPQLGVLSKLNRQENGAFRKRFSKHRNLKTTALRSCVVGKHFENGASRSKTMTSRFACNFPDLVFLKHKSKMTGNCCVFKFLRRSVDGKYLTRFEIENSVFEFFMCSQCTRFYIEMIYGVVRSKCFYFLKT